MTYYILFFIAYFALTSILHRAANRPVFKTERFLGQKWRAVKVETVSITEWAQKSRYIPPYLKNTVDQITGGEIESVIIKKQRFPVKSVVFSTPSSPDDSIFDAAFKSGVQCGRTPDITEFKRQYLANPWQAASSIPDKERTPFEKWKASNPANTWQPWWLSKQVFNSMEDVAIHEHQKEQVETQKKAFDAGLNACNDQMKEWIELLDGVL